MIEISFFGGKIKVKECRCLGDEEKERMSELGIKQKLAKRRRNGGISTLPLVLALGNIYFIG